MPEPDKQTAHVEMNDKQLTGVTGGEYSDGSVRCVCIIGGSGNW